MPLHSCQPSRSRRDTHDMKAPVPLPPDRGLCLLLVPTEQTWLNLTWVTSTLCSQQTTDSATYMQLALEKWAWHMQKFPRAYARRSVPFSSLEKLAGI